MYTQDFGIVKRHDNEEEQEEGVMARSPADQREALTCGVGWEITQKTTVICLYENPKTHISAAL